AAEAVAHYDEVVAELGDVLAEDGAPWRHAPATRRISEESGSCVLTPGTWSPQSPLPAPEGEEGWDALRGAVSPVVEAHGLAPVDEVTAQGSRTVLETTDGHGATLRITAEGEIRIWGAAVEAETCAEESLGGA